MILVDSNIPMYLVGAEHPHKVDARRLLERAVAEKRRLVTDAEVLQEIYLGVLGSFFSDSLDDQQWYRNTWARIPHFYGSPYYVFQYATSKAAASLLHRRMTEGDEASRTATVEAYLELLRSGGNDHPVTLLTKAGVDLATTEPTEALVAKPWLRAFLNSVIVSVSSTTLMVLSAAIVGYALAKLPFRGGRLVYNFILFQMFYPAVILLIPTFLLVKAFGWFNTYWAMIVPKAMSVWAIFMYTSFFKSVPQEIIDSARVDGASEWRIIFRIMIPLSKSITIIVKTITALWSFLRSKPFSTTHLQTLISIICSLTLT